jgi:hypothetical protein
MMAKGTSSLLNHVGIVISGNIVMTLLFLAANTFSIFGALVQC